MIQPRQQQAKDNPPEVLMDRTQERVHEWRTHWLVKAGWSPDRADFIARLNPNDLLEYGFTQKEADRVSVDLWRQACHAIKCGSEAQALYILGLSSEG